MKTYFIPFGTGIVVGILLAVALFGGKREEDSVTYVYQPEQVEGETRPAQTEMKLVQNDSTIGHLKKGARLWFRPDAEAGEQLQLLLEWENDGTFETLFRSVADDKTQGEGKAFATLETY